MTKDVFLSVILAAGKDSDLLGRTLNGVLSQTYTNIEVLVADSGEWEEVNQLAKAYAEEDTRLRVFDVADATTAQLLNTCLRYAKGRYIMVLKPGDTLPVDSFTKMHQIAVTKPAEIVAGLHEVTNTTGTYHSKKLKEFYTKQEWIASEDPMLINDLHIHNKWFRRHLLEQQTIRFGDFGQITDVVFVATCIAACDKIYTCPFVVCSKDNRLIDSDGNVVEVDAEEIDSGNLRGCINGFGLICRLAADFGDQYVEELAAAFLQKILIDQYYRRIWFLDDQCEEMLVTYMNRMLKVISSHHYDSLMRHNMDLVCQNGFKSREELLDLTFITLAVSQSFEKDRIGTLIKDLYGQAAVSFFLYIHQDLQPVIPREYKDMKNIRFVSHDPFNTALKESSSPMIGFLDEAIFYDRQSLRRMASSLLERPTDFICMMPMPMEDGKAAVTNLLKQAYEKNNHSLEWMMSNKLFMNIVLRDSHVELLGDSQEDTDFLFRALEHRMISHPGMISLMSEEEMVEGSAGLPYGLKGAYKKEEEPVIPKKSGGFFRQLFHKNRPEEESPVKDVATAHKEEQLSYREQCYLNLDIDGDSIFLQNKEKLPVGDLLYILRYMTDHMPEKKLFVAVTKETADTASKICQREHMHHLELVVKDSDKYCDVVYSARVLLCDDLMPPWWQKKLEQKFVSFFARTPLVKTGLSSEHPDSEFANHGASDLQMADYVILPNKFTMLRLEEDLGLPFGLEDKTIFCGRPGTSQLLNEALRQRIRTKLSLDDNQEAVLWLPDQRFRGARFGRYVVENLSPIVQAIGGKQILYLNRQMLPEGMEDLEELGGDGRGSVIRWMPEDVDIYEMMAASDILITDYSPMMVDFAVTRRKIVVYCNDRKQVEQDHGFYVDIRTLPFPYAATKEDLQDVLHSNVDYDDRDFLMVFNAADGRDNVEQMLTKGKLTD